MTRETRIGLLVGLLFIIMFGLVLSGLTSTGAPPGAPSLGAPSNPPAANNAPTEDVREIGWAPAMDPDRRPVPVSGDPSTRPSGGAVSGGRPAGTGEVTVAWSKETPGGDAVAPVPPAARTGADPERTTRTGASETTYIGETPVIAHRPEDAAGAPRDRDRMPPTEVIPAGSRAPETPLPPGARIYEVKKGDTLCGIARAEYGTANASKHTLILEANKDKIKTPSGLKVGMKLVIPPLPGAGAPAAGAPTPTSGPSTPEGGPGTPSHPRSPTGIAFVPPGRTPGLVAHPDDGTARGAPVVKTYVVKSGDTIQAIARATGTTMEKILKANRVDPRKLKIGMKLEIPT